MAWSEADVRRAGWNLDKLRERKRNARNAGRSKRTTDAGGDPVDNDKTQSVYFVISGRPVGKQRPRLDPRTGRAYTPKKTRVYERKVKRKAMSSRPAHWPKDQSYEVEILAVYPDRRYSDVSNILKAVEDGIDGVLYDDDRQVYRVTATRTVDEKTDTGYVEVTVTCHTNPEVKI